jgi:hypothetical protein
MGFCPFVAGSGASGIGAELILADAAGVAKRKTMTHSAATGQGDLMIVRERITVAGTYHRKMQLRRFTGSGSLSNGWTATEVSHIVATRMLTP